MHLVDNKINTVSIVLERSSCDVLSTCAGVATLAALITAGATQPLRLNKDMLAGRRTNIPSLLSPAPVGGSAV